MEGFFASGRAAELILLLLALEALALLVWRRWRGGGIAPRDWLPLLAAGACFALALRGALLGAWWGWVALPLLLAGAAHLLDLVLRGRRSDAKH